MSDDLEILLRRRFARTEEALASEEFTSRVQERLRGFQGARDLVRTTAGVVCREMALVFRRMLRIPHLAAALLGTLALAGWALIG